MTDTPTAPGNKKPLGIWICTALVIGNMIGSGIFLLPANLAEYGGISVFGWVIGAGGAMCIALVLARLATIIPKAGGHYAYTRNAFGDFAGFLVGWGYWISLMSGNAAISIAMVGYLGVFFPVLTSSPALTIFVAIAAIWVLTWVNMMGVRNAGFVVVLTVILKLLPLVAIATLGLLYFDAGNFEPFVAGDRSIFAALTATVPLTLWAFLGLESATIPANEVDCPEKIIPKATILGVVFTGVVYILATVAVMGILPVADVARSTAPFADAAGAIWGEWAAYAVAAGATVSCFGALNGWILLTGQFPLAVARDNLFPGVFGKVSRRGTPILGLIIGALLVTVMVSFVETSQTGNWLAELFKIAILLATFTSLVPYAFSAMAELVIFVRDREQFRGQRLLGASLIAVVAFFFSIWAIGGTGAETVYWGTIFLLLGLPIYVWMLRGRHRSG